MPQRRRILVAEDDAAVRRLIRRFLAGLPDLEVEECASAVEALLAVRKRPFDLLIFDWSLQEAEGCEAIRLARQEMKPLARVLVVTGARVSEQERQANRGLVDRWLTKPFGREELRGAVARA